MAILPDQKFSIQAFANTWATLVHLRCTTVAVWSCNPRKCSKGTSLKLDRLRLLYLRFRSFSTSLLGIQRPPSYFFFWINCEKLSPNSLILVSFFSNCRTLSKIQEKSWIDAILGQFTEMFIFPFRCIFSSPIASVSAVWTIYPHSTRRYAFWEHTRIG